MSVFGPRQVAELVLGDAVATETTASTFIASADAGELQVVGQDGGAVAAGEKFKFLQKTAGAAGKGLNYEFTGIVDPSKVEYVTVKSYSPEVAKQVTVTGFTGTVRENSTYSVEIRLYQDGGTLSPENFRIIPGYYVTGEAGEDTFADVINGIKDAIDKNQALEGNTLFDIAANADNIVIDGQIQSVIRGKIVGRPIEFDVIAKVQSNISDPLTKFYSDLDVETTRNSFPGVGTGKDAINFEWFVKGYDYESYRGTSYPNDFDTPYYADGAGQYNIIVISHYADFHNVQDEKQYKTLSVFINEADGVAGTNAILASLRTAGVPNVPADIVDPTP